jgi:sugar O-acyltransferase (sialic acid O-acetyltransferase NeuD family)
MKQPIVLIGSSGHAKVVADCVEREGKYSLVGLIDSFRSPGERAESYPVIGAEDALPGLVETGEVYGGLIAIGDNWKRYLMAEKIKLMVPQFVFVNAFHPSAQIAAGVGIGDGTAIMAGAVVNPGCTIGACCILNTKSSLDHDSVMNDFSSLAPNATTGGCVTIGAYAAVSLGASIIHRRRIGEHTVIGAGAVVVSDVPGYSVAYGNPARVVRQRLASDEYL